MKILIIGSGPNWREAPFGDESYEVWSYGLVADLLPRVDVAFEIHRRDKWEDFHTVQSEEEYAKRLRSLYKLVWMQKKYADIPLSAEFPKDAVAKCVGPHFSSTLAYQLGLAILRHQNKGDVEEIGLFGFDLCTWEEWAEQRPNVNRLVGLAQGRGIRVMTPASSKLLGIPYFYGYELPEEESRAVDSLLIERMAQLSAMMAHLADLHIAKKEMLRFQEVKKRAAE